MVSVAILAAEAWTGIPEGQRFRPKAHFSPPKRTPDCIYTNAATTRELSRSEVEGGGRKIEGGRGRSKEEGIDDRISGAVLLATQKPTWEDMSAGVGAMGGEVGEKKAGMVTGSVCGSVLMAEWWCDGQDVGALGK